MSVRCVLSMQDSFTNARICGNGGGGGGSRNLRAGIKIAGGKTRLIPFNLLRFQKMQRMLAQINFNLY